MWPSCVKKIDTGVKSVKQLENEYFITSGF